MKNLISSFLSAMLGGAVVFAALTYTGAPPVQPVRKIIETRRAVDNRTGAGQLSAQDIYEEYGDAVVHVKASVTGVYNDFFGLPVPEDQVSAGSGFIVSDEGYVITNAHVVGGSNQITVQLSDSAEIDAKLVGLDQSTDLAFLKIDLSGHRHKVLSLGDSRSTRVGEKVYAIGNPLGYDRSMSEGIISALNREIRAPNDFPIRGVIQTDAAINRGNSGGPLISSSGKVIGVTSQIATTGAGSIGIAFAIPSSTVLKVFEEVKKTGKASHAWIGIQGEDLFPEVVKELDLKVSKGVMIVQVIKTSPADKGGLRGATGTIRIGGNLYDTGGDIVTEVNGVKIAGMDDLLAEMSRYRAGEEVDVIFFRDKDVKTVKLTLGERPEKSPLPR